MQRLNVCFRFLMIYALFSVLPAAICFFLLGEKGFKIALLVIAMCLFLVILFSERLIIRIFKADTEIPKGLDKSLAWAAGSSDQVPRVRILKEPNWRIIVTRSLFGSGTILVSQGLIAYLSERDLRSVLQECIKLNYKPDTVFQGLRTILTLFLFKMISALNCTSKKKMTPFLATRFLIIFPFLNLLKKLENGIDEEKLPVVLKQGSYNAARYRGEVLASLFGRLGSINCLPVAQGPC